MGLFDKLREPVFLKESSDAERQIERLKALEPLLNGAGKTKLKQDIKLVEYGIAGEKNIAFELKNSHMPMYVLHDIYLESDGLSAQIDYIVFTRSLSFVIECKNLVGDIEINNSGDFIRTMEYGGKKKKEGIYSPITQNQRHLQLMKKIKMEKKNGVFQKFMTNRYFEDFNKSVVVLSNPKTVLNAKYAKKDVKSQVIRADQLVSYIKETCKNSKEFETSDDSMREWAQSYLDLHIEKEHDYTERYRSYMLSPDEPVAVAEQRQIQTIVSTSDSAPVEETNLFKALKAYRLMKSREENIKPYFIYNDNQLRDLISKMPQTKEELQSVAGFGPVKVEKYGGEILSIVEMNR